MPSSNSRIATAAYLEFLLLIYYRKKTTQKLRVFSNPAQDPLKSSILTSYIAITGSQASRY